MSVAADKRATSGAKIEEGPSSAQAAYAAAEDKKGIEELEALVAKGKSKRRSRLKLNCWMAEDLLVEDAEGMLKKARANPGNCHPEVLKELNAIVKRVCSECTHQQVALQRMHGASRLDRRMHDCKCGSGRADQECQSQAQGPVPRITGITSGHNQVDPPQDPYSLTRVDQGSNGLG